MDVSSSLGSALGGVPLVGTAMNAGGAILGYKGVKDTNETNANIANARNVFEREEALKAREFSAGETKINREFQADQVLKKMAYDERMSSTAVQRRMKDMREGGINPILAGKFDASTPAAAAAAGNVGATAKANAHGYTAQNKMGAALDRLSTALDIKTKIANIENINAQTGLTQNKADVIDPAADMMEIIENLTSDLNTNAKQNYTGLKDQFLNFLKQTGQNIGSKTYDLLNPKKEPMRITIGRPKHWDN